MSNSYFQFKQFTIQQGRCAMKVSTDACIQGAWTPVAENVKHVLDIGTGTGLLSLMLAQRYSRITVDAIEIDIDACTQASENITASPWADRIKLIETDVNAYTPALRYDMIICNPPFFLNSLLGPQAERNKARHNVSLSYKQLFAAMQRLLTDEGYASVLLPAKEHGLWQQLLENNSWTIHKKLLIEPREGAAPNRVVSLCSRNYQPQPDEVLAIRLKGSDEYTVTFTSLLKPFYLKLV